MEAPVLPVPVAPCPVTGHHWEESGPVLLALALQVFWFMLPHATSAFPMNSSLVLLSLKGKRKRYSFQKFITLVPLHIQKRTD